MKIDSAIDTEGTLDATMRLEERGDDEFLVRSAFRGTPQNRWEDLTQVIVARMGFGGKVSEVSVANPEDTTKPFTISFKYHRPEFPDWKNHQITLPMPFFMLPELTDEQKSAKSPLPLGPPSDVTYQTTVNLPKDYSALLPDNVSLKHEFAEFSANYALESGGTLHGTLSLKTVQREVAGEKRKEFAELTKSVGEVYSRYIPVISPSGAVPASMANNMALFGNLMKNPEAAIPELEKRVAEDPENQGVAMMLAQTYLKVGRPKDAAALVEKEMAKSPDNLTFRLPLGEAYLAAGETDKAMEQFSKGLEGDPPATELNNVAYLLAHAKVKLNEAESFSRRSVETLSRSTAAIGAGDANHADFQLMLQLAASWDTLGWIKFQEGDAESAEKYAKASWALVQKAEVGEHLVEIYEKEGKLEIAALVGLSASAAYGDPQATAKLKKEMERLSKHLPQKPIDGAVELSTMRTVHVAFRPKLQRKVESAEVLIVIDSENKPADVAFKSGNEELRKGSAALASCKYPQIFPDSTPVKILREGIFTCSPYTKDCSVTLMPAADAAVGVD